MNTPRNRFVEGIQFPEGLRWHDGELWFSDFHQRRVYSVDATGDVRERAFVGSQPSGLGFTPAGEPLVVGMYDQSLLKLTDGRPSLVATVGSVVKGPCNDMFVDAKGRAYISGFGYHALYLGMDDTITTCLAFVDTDGSVRAEAPGLYMPNGVVGTPDGKTLIVAETTRRRLTAFDVAENGSLSNPRLFANLGHRPPDGLAIDAEGAVWVATFDTGEVIRVREGGEVLQVVRTGGAWATACALGGPDGHTLYCAVADTQMENTHESVGWIETLTVDVPAPEKARQAA